MHDLLNNALNRVGHLTCCRSVGCSLFSVFLGGGKWLTDLAVVAVDSNSLDAELPRKHVQCLDVFDGRFFRHVDGL